LLLEKTVRKKTKVLIPSYYQNGKNQGEKSSKTGIEQVDSLLNGGFPEGSTILLAGASGSGKTILSMQWLFQGIQQEENALYITVTEPLFVIVRNLETLSFYNRTALENEQLKILDVRHLYEKNGFNQKKSALFYRTPGKTNQC